MPTPGEAPKKVGTKNAELPPTAQQVSTTRNELDSKPGDGRMKHPCLVTVLWLDACFFGDEEGVPGSTHGLDEEGQVLETPGWYLGCKDGQVLLGYDLGAKDPKRTTRGVYRIPKRLVLAIVELERGKSLYNGRAKG